MKIGIITLPLHTNYGGILQAYALQTVLERMGNDVFLIEEKSRPARLPLWKAPLSYSKRILKNLSGNPVPIFYEQKIEREKSLIKQNTDRFINKHIKRKIVDDFSILKEAEFDALIVGSDQIWRPMYFRPIKHAFLDFAEDWEIKRMAYAVSFGTDNWEYSIRQEKTCRNLAKKFDFVSVREMSGIKLCNEHLGLKAELVLDPTLLLAEEDYIRLFQSDNNIQESKGNLLCYILDETPEKMQFIHREAEQRGLQPFFVNSLTDIRAPLDQRIQPPVEEWLRGFYDAKFVITDSFHACIFAIIFKKPFIAFGNIHRGMSRFISLLDMFGLKERLTDGKYNQPGKIDWTEVVSILSDKQRDSYTFLTQLNNRQK